MTEVGLGPESPIVTVESKVAEGEVNPESVFVAVISPAGSHVPLTTVYSETTSVVEVNHGWGPSGAGVYGTSAVIVEGKNVLVAFPEALDAIDVIVLAVGEAVPGGTRSVSVCSKIPLGEDTGAVSFEPGDVGIVAGGAGGRVCIGAVTTIDGCWFSDDGAIGMDCSGGVFCARSKVAVIGNSSGVVVLCVTMGNGPVDTASGKESVLRKDSGEVAFCKG